MPSRLTVELLGSVTVPAVAFSLNDSFPFGGLQRERRAMRTALFAERLTLHTRWGAAPVGIPLVFMAVPAAPAYQCAHKSSNDAGSSGGGVRGPGAMWRPFVSTAYPATIAFRIATFRRAFAVWEFTILGSNHCG